MLSKIKSSAVALILVLSLSNVGFANEMRLNDETPAKNDRDKKEPAENKSDNKTGAKTSPEEMAKVVEALEERIKLLEEKLARMNEPSATPGAASATLKDDVKPEAIAEIKKEVQEMKEEAKKNESFSNFFRSVEFSGIVDGYYSYNNNKVDMFTQGRAFDVRHNSLSLQLAKATLERKNSKESPLGFRIDMGLGETVDRIISVSDSSRNDGTKYMLQAYASYVAPIGSGLTLDFGKFYTPIGAEVIETKDNFNYSRGWLFAFGPYYHTGLRVKYGVNDKVSVAGFLVNGWDNMFENNVSDKFNKTLGFQIGLTPSKKFALTATYMGGQEAPLANVPFVSDRDNWRNIFDTVGTIYVTDKLTLLGNFVYGNDGDNTGTRGYWTGFAAYLKYAFNNRFAFSPRFEVFNDHAGLRTGVPQTVKDITLTQEIKLFNNFLTRLEFRRDFSNQDFFTNSKGFARNNQNTFIVGLSYFFTTRE